MWCPAHGKLLVHCDGCVADLRAENEALKARVAALIELTREIAQKQVHPNAVEVEIGIILAPAKEGSDE